MKVHRGYQRRKGEATVMCIQTFFFREIGKFSQSGLSLLFLSGFETFPSFFSLLLPCQNINGKAGPKMPWPHKQAKLQWQTHLFKRFQK
jgi:hypothetical protein